MIDSVTISKPLIRSKQMLVSVKVHVHELKRISRDTEESKMLRGLHNLRRYKTFLLEPYINSINIYANCSGSKLRPEVQALPKLPVPKLEDTMDKYLLTVRPFLNDEEFANTTALANDFTQGLGKKLQAILEKRAEKHVNWLEEWWLNTAYLEYRDPVVIYSSPGLLLPYKQFVNQEEQLLCAAKMLTAAVNYKILIETDKIPLEKMGKSPLDMGQYKKIFGTCRIPAEKRDKLSFTTDSRHVTVIHNNHIFHVDLWGNDNVRLNEDQLIKQLKTVMDLSTKPNNQGVGILTSENRDTWAKAYKLLSKDEKNRVALTDIATSIAVLCLDAPCDVSKVTNDEGRRTIGGEQTIHGGGSKINGANRWYDKTIQFIIGADGLRGITYEHSPAEGQPIAVLMDSLVKYIDQPKADGPASASPVVPKILEFQIDQDVAQMINQAKTNLDILVDSLDLCCFQYRNYGKNFIKSQKLSPDSYLQMAMQLAFYRLHKTPGAHYESAATRMFTGGRTETIRSCSIESVEFAKTMLNPQSTPKDKVNALKKAIDGHKKYTVQALQGLGVDRHLLGLRLAAIENGIDIHKIYSDVGYTRSAHMRISTSQVALKSDGFMCYGPLVPDGYSTCYNPRDDVVNFATAAFKGPGLKGTVKVTSCGGYRNALEQSMNDMHDVLLLNTLSKL